MADLTHTVQVALGGVLTDVTDVVQGFTVGGGRGREYETFSAGTGSIQIVDVNNTYIPGGGGTYSGEQWIGREVRITVSAGGHTGTVFRGHVEDIDVDFVDVNHAILTVDVVDPMALLARTEIGSSATFDSELSSARVNAVLDLDEVDGGYWTDTARDIRQGVATLQADADPAGNTLQYLQSVERAEGGRLFVRHGDNDGGILAFRPRPGAGGPEILFERLDTGDVRTLIDGGTAETTVFDNTYDGGTAATTDYDGGGYIEFDGAADWAEMPSPQTAGDDFIFEIELSADDWTPTFPVWLFGDRNSSSGLEILLGGSGELQVTVDDLAVAGTGLGLTDGVRHTLRVEFDGSAEQADIYVDNVFDQTLDFSVGAGQSSVGANPGSIAFVGTFDKFGSWDGKIHGWSYSIDGTTVLDVDVLRDAWDGATSFEAETGGTVELVSTSATVTDVVGGDAPAQLSVKFQTVDVNFGSESLVNRVVYTREGGTEQVVEDVASQDRFGIRTVSQSGLFNATDADVLDLAETRLARAASPRRNVDGLSVLLDALSDDEAAMMARLTVGDVVQVTADVPGSGGDTLTQTVRVEQVQHAATPSVHRVSYRLTTLADQFAGLTDGGTAATVSFADTWDGGTAEEVQRDRVLSGGDATFG